MYDLAKLSLKNIANTQVCQMGSFPTVWVLQLSGGSSTPRCYSMLREQLSSLNNVIVHVCSRQVVACMNPTAGSFLVNPRLQRWFATFAIGLPGPTSLLTIYQVSSSVNMGDAASSEDGNACNFCTDPTPGADECYAESKCTAVALDCSKIDTCALHTVFKISLYSLHHDSPPTAADDFRWTLAAFRRRNFGAIEQLNQGRSRPSQPGS